jgi:3'-phosphoadenosine 5'-phosphosulfate sulfotransferase (PAPS reductase)/FAD synthetase
MRHELPICSVSGGKDSTALYNLMVEFFGQNFLPIFADTGHEHPVTVNYVKNLHIMAGGPVVQFVKADFSRQLEKKGFSKTEYTFLDMMLWKGRAPSTKAQFCTEHLKLWPIKFFLENNYPRDQYEWFMFTGIRGGESVRRSKMSPFSWNDFFDCESTLPMLYETEEFIFEYLESKGVPPNPLYALGYGRVGCFPCIHANKNELMLLPSWAWDRLQYYEDQLGRTWFGPGTVPGIHIPTIEDVRNWCMTTPKIRGNQFNMFRAPAEDAPSCMTGWIACE